MHQLIPERRLAALRVGEIKPKPPFKQRARIATIIE